MCGFYWSMINIVMTKHIILISNDDNVAYTFSCYCINCCLLSRRFYRVTRKQWTLIHWVLTHWVNNFSCQFYQTYQFLNSSKTEALNMCCHFRTIFHHEFKMSNIYVDKIYGECNINMWIVSRSPNPISCAFVMQMNLIELINCAKFHCIS